VCIIGTGFCFSDSDTQQNKDNEAIAAKKRMVNILGDPVVFVVDPVTSGQNSTHKHANPRVVDPTGNKQQQQQQQQPDKDTTGRLLVLLLCHAILASLMTTID
jgi:hypothetical protein